MDEFLIEKRNIDGDRIKCLKTFVYTMDGELSLNFNHHTMYSETFHITFLPVVRISGMLLVFIVLVSIGNQCVGVN